jgi:hypothetical protein
VKRLRPERPFNVPERVERRGAESPSAKERLRPERGAKRPSESERGWGPASAKE